MADRFQEAIEELVAEIKTKEQEVAELKRTVNFLRTRDGLAPLFEDTESRTQGGRGLLAIRPDQFYGKSPITAAREYLEQKGQAALPDEIADALERGSFDYKAQGWNNKENRSRNLAISMGKNSGMFHRLPNGYYGLVKWYPELGRRKRAGAAPEVSAAQEEEILDESGEKAQNDETEA